MNATSIRRPMLLPFLVAIVIAGACTSAGAPAAATPAATVAPVVTVAPTAPPTPVASVAAATPAPPTSVAVPASAVASVAAATPSPAPTAASSGGYSTGGGGGGYGDYGPAATPAPATGSAGGGGSSGALGAADISGVGTVLAAPDGKTLYTYKPDGTGASTCTGGCASAWPPLTATAVPALPAGWTGKVTLVSRDDGSQQVAYDGHPVYEFSGDDAPGQANGQGTGGKWFVVAK